MEDTRLFTRNFIVFSYSEGETIPTQNLFCTYLMDKIGCLTLVLPPLRERPEELSNLATLHINRFNSLLGKQIIGFESDALPLIQKYYWPHNLDQFKRVLKELVIHTPNFYISKESVSDCLRKEQRLFVPLPKETVCGLDLNKSLDEITYDIIHIVLEQENGRQKKAAERLGISRSTLWRILKAMR